MVNSRVIATKILVQVSLHHHTLEHAFSLELSRYTCTIQERSLIKAYCFGTLRWFIQLNAIVNQLLHKPLEKKHEDLLCLMCVALYELMHMRTPDYAVVNETVNAVIKLKKNWAKGLVNKTLKQFLKDQSKILEKINLSLDLKYAHPKWLIELLKNAWPAHLEDILKANCQQPPLFLRVNLLQTSREIYQQLLKAHDIQSQSILGTPTALQIIPPCSVDKLPGFFAGLCSVQDLAGQQVIPLLQLAPNQLILDACAAPGSKTCHILEQEPGIAKIVAIDHLEHRLLQLKENISRLKLPENKFELLTADATEPAHWWNGQLFDRILLDAPCSATGVIRRHPDSKLLRQLKDISQQAKQQFLLLNKLWPLLKPGGLMLYTTCSILTEENEALIHQFVNLQPNIKAVHFNLPGAISLSYGKQLLPTENGHDGFYYALLERTVIDHI